MPPIHPAFVHFPIALMIFSFVMDLITHFRNSPSLRNMGLVALSGAVIGGLGAVAAGYYDMGHASLGETHEYVDFHMTVGWILASFLLGLTLWRWLISRQSQPRIGSLYVIAALLTLTITLFQGWYGGELVFSQGAGVAAAGKGTEPPGDGYQRLSSVTRHLAGLINENSRHDETRDDAHKHN